MNVEYWLFSLIVLLLINIAVCVYVVSRDEYEKHQKLLQCAIIWLFPLIGAVGIFMFSKSLSEPVQKDKGSFGGGPKHSGFFSGGGE